MTTWNEFKITAPSMIEEPLTDFLMEIGSAGVSIQNSEDIKQMTADSGDSLFDLKEMNFPKSGMIMTGYFSPGTEMEKTEILVRKKIEELEELGFKIHPYSFLTEDLKEEDWENAWKQYYHVQRVSRFLTIVPEWEAYSPQQKSELCIRLDPGLAFGTGTHPTTILSLQGLETVVRGGETVLDVGTGSGVLTIGSALLGASAVHAYDVDDIAVNAAKSNIALNQLDASITVQKNNLLQDIPQSANIVVANILADIIIRLIPQAWSALYDDGFFVCSGIIDHKKEDVQHALEEQGFTIKRILQMEDWFAFVAQKTTD